MLSIIVEQETFLYITKSTDVNLLDYGRKKWFEIVCRYLLIGFLGSGERATLSRSRQSGLI